MDGLEVFRAYHIALKLQPELPEARLMALLPKIDRDLLQSAKKGGLGNPIAPIEQLIAAKELGQQAREQYLQASELDVPLTDYEFRAIICATIDRIVSNMQDIDLAFKLDVQRRLSLYLEGHVSALNKTRRLFSDRPPRPARFLTGFRPIDCLLGQVNKEKINEGIVRGIITLLAQPGEGKTYLAQAIASQHTGSVWFFDAENGEELIYERQEQLHTVNIDAKEYIFGDYDIEEIYQEAKDNPDPERLIVLDSLQSVWGNGQSGTDYINYQNGYKYARKMIMDGLCKFVIMSTHPKTEADGLTFGSVGASQIISKKTNALVNVKKLERLPDGYTSYEFFSIKHRDGIPGKRVTFTFRHRDGTVGEILTGDVTQHS